MDLDHKHYIVNLNSPNTKEFTAEACINLLNDLVSAINMTTFLPARAKRCDTVGNEGVTGDIVIETSHITIHTWDTGRISLDLYSCKAFSIETVREVLIKYFQMFVITKEYLINRN